MRFLSYGNGKGNRRRHMVPDGQQVALCGTAPSMGYRWQPAPKSARTCTNCQMLHHNNQGIDYSRGISK